MAKLQRRVSAALLAARRCNVGLHVFPCAVTVLGGFGGQGTRHGIPTDGPNRLNTGQHLIQEFSTPDFALSGAARGRVGLGGGWTTIAYTIGMETAAR